MCRVTVISFLVSAFLTCALNVYKDRYFWWPNSRQPNGIAAEAFIDQAIPPTYSSLRVTVFSKCVSCHSEKGFGPEDFTNYHRLISSGKVVPGSARASKIFVETASMRMPLDGPKLSKAELVALEQWINSGAQNN